MTSDMGAAPDERLPATEPTASPFARQRHRSGTAGARLSLRDRNAGRRLRNRQGGRRAAVDGLCHHRRPRREEPAVAAIATAPVWLGARLYHYGLAYARSLDFLSVATQEMHDLGRESGETVQVCGRDGDHMLVLAMADGPGHFQVTSRVGTRVPLNWTASGRLLVGHLPGTGTAGAVRALRRIFADRACRCRSGRSVRSGQTGACRHEFPSRPANPTMRLPASPRRSATTRATASRPFPSFCPSRRSPTIPTLHGQVKASAERIEKMMGWRSHS